MPLAAHKSKSLSKSRLGRLAARDVGEGCAAETLDVGILGQAVHRKAHRRSYPVWGCSVVVVKIHHELHGWH